MKRVSFRLNDPQAREVFLCGTFNTWDPSVCPMKRGRKGLWSASLTLEPGTYEYRFLVDGEWQNDPHSETVPNPYGACNNVRIVI